MLLYRFQILNRFSGLALALVLSACAAGTVQTAGIEERAIARWDTLLSGDLDGAYQFLSPAYRSSVPSLQYQRGLLLQKVRWTAAHYIDSECLESSCKVRISLDYSLIHVLPGVRRFDGTQTVVENWVKREGSWWLVPKK